MNKGLINLISSNKLFEGVDISKVDFGNIGGNLLTFSEGTLIFSEGDTSAEVYLVMDGRVNVLRKSTLGTKGDELFEKDSFFGFEEFLEDVNRICTAIALTDAYLISFNKEETRILIRQNEKIKENIVKYSNVPNVDQIHRFLVEEELKEEGVTEFVEAKPEKIVEENKEKQKEEIPAVVDENIDLDIVPPPIEEAEVPQEENIENEMLNYYGDSSGNAAPEEVEEEPAPEINKTEEIQKPVLPEVPKGITDLPGDLWGDEGEENQPEISTPSFDIAPVSPLEEEENPGEAEVTETPMIIEKEPHREEEHRLESGEPKDVSEQIPETESSTELTIDFTKISEDADKIFLSQNENELNSNFLNLVKTALNVEVVLFFKFDGKENLVADFKKGETEITISESLEGSSFGNSFRDNKPQIISLPGDWEKLETKNLQQLGIDIRNLLIYPVRTPTEKLGVLTLINKKSGEFTEEDVNSLRRLKDLYEARLKQFAFARSQFLSLKENIYQRLVNFLTANVKEKIIIAKKYSEKALTEDEPKNLIELTIEQLDLARKAVSEIDLLKIEPKDLRLVELNLNDYIEKFFAESEELLKSKYINVFKNLEADVFVKIDAELMKTALTKVCENACESMPFGGNFVIKSFAEGNNVILSFIDNGNGIEEENIPLIFEPFVAFAKEGHPGLGLAIAKKIIETHKGTISAKLNDKQGITIEVKLPTVQY